MARIIRNTTSDQFDVRIDLRDVLHKFSELPKRVATNVVRRGLLAGAKVIGEEARRLAPQPQPKNRRRGKKGGPAPAKLKRGDKGYYATGLLKKSIVWQTRGVFKDASGVPIGHRAVVVISKPKGGGKSARMYAHMVEFGTKPHRTGKGAVNVVYKRSKKKLNLTGGLHPGQKAQPFLGPAIATKGEEAIRAIEQTVRRELVVEVGKLSRETAGSTR
jgi:HK97 gp10 family phage protein